MRFLTGEILVLMLTVLDGVRGELSLYGENVCMTTETYEERTPVKKMIPHEMIIKERCWNILKYFSCEKKKTFWKEHVEYVMVPRTKIVPRCCPGYVEVNRVPRLPKRTECVPHCPRGCLHGVCVAPDDCACNPGFHGFICGYECPQGYWGKGCNVECKCFKNGKCDKVRGCVCQSGWMGLRCESACPDGYYGNSCANKCDCTGHNCNHITGECITTTTEPSTTSTTEAQPALITTERDKTSRSDTTHSISTSTETAAEVYHSTERVHSRMYHQSDEISNTDIIISQSTKETTEETVATTNEIIATVKEMKLPEVDEFESAQEVVLTKSTTETGTFGDEITTLTTAREEDENNTNLVNTKVVSREDLEGTITQEVETTTIFPLRTVNEPTIGKNKTSWISHTASNIDMDKNKTDNLIFEGKGNSSKESIFRFLHFLPSLSVISAASFLIVIIAAKWLIVNRRRKTKMLVVVATEKGNIFQPEEQVKIQAENLFWVNNSTVNPVYMSDVDLNNTTPILETFKPLDKGAASK